MIAVGSGQLDLSIQALSALTTSRSFLSIVWERLLGRRTLALSFERPVLFIIYLLVTLPFVIFVVGRVTLSKIVKTTDT